MKQKKSIVATASRSFDRFFRRISVRTRLLVSSMLRRYTDWRIGAWASEKVTNSAQGSILLTFDDYGSVAQIERLLGILDEFRVRGVFFLVGNWAQEHGDLVEKIRGQGHIVANHTYSHANLLSLSEEGVRREIETGVAGRWLRPPFGYYNANVRQIAASLGYDIKYWSIDSDDWRGASAAYMFEKIMRELHPGAVILFHGHVDATAEVLPKLIREIRRRGYRLCEPGESIWGETA